MTLPAHLPRHLRKPGEEGYRTPVIEDVENNNGYFPSIQLTHQSLPRTPPRCETPPVLSEFRNRTAAQQNGVSQPGSNAGTAPIPLRWSGRFPQPLSWQERIRHLTWSYFTLTMATGGLANVLYTIPFRSRWLEVLGTVVFLVNIVFYIIIWALMGVRFYLFPYTFKASFLHPTESLFAPAAIVSLGTILINVAQYGPSHTGEWLHRATVVLFWFDAALAVVLSAGIYLIM